ncbi:hypothetical protein DXC97_02455 [Lachnospiraceae bacterium TF09-5]|nr:hypothetical protein DXC97_02455 [Lachnospiraceae bacterium TF09-5]
MSLNIIEAAHTVDYIPIYEEKVPYSFSIKLDDRTFTFTVKYNEQGGFFTADLAITATGEILCYGDPIRYGRPMFGSIEDDRYPIPVIIPYCLVGKETEVNRSNFGKTVKLYLHERREKQ